MSMVVGIFPDSTGLLSVVDGLYQAGVDIERLRVLSCDEIPTELASSGVQYVWLGDVNRGAPSEIMTDGGGTSVPSGPGGGGGVGIYDGELLESLSEIAIPDSKTDEYAHAVESGLIVVGYPCLGIDSAALRQLYNSAGATSVAEF